MLARAALCSLLLPAAAGRVLSVLDFGATTSDTAGAVNRDALNMALGNATAGDTVHVPAGTFHMLGGVSAAGLTNVTLLVDGRLAAVYDLDAWPIPDGRQYSHFIELDKCSGLTVTGQGTIDGNGKPWWNLWVLKPPKGKRRPKLLVLSSCDNVLVERLTLVNSPSFHLLLSDVRGAEVRYITIDVDRWTQRSLKSRMRAARLAANPKLAAFPGHWLQPEDLNTDGIDPSGSDVWVHDCKVANDDDSIALKPCSADRCRSPCSQHMLFENLELSGFGASIGSVPPHSPSPNCVRNVTFRNISMPHTGKGIYVKSNPSCSNSGPGAKAILADITYEDVNIYKPLWWSIWIGPQQQHEPGSALGDKCALDYPIDKHCPTQGCADFRNITLRRVNVTEPLLAPGVLLGNASNPMQGIVFEDVVFTGMHAALPFPSGAKYRCTAVDLTAIRSNPVPDCS
eukprot:TRINITY_DN32203_c0_g1_i1.p1 TRINITY_DN32203_c0_g1~~TRINITY_DN32203_c0_g1_i1.p1  ORF type:complete len:473 (+),score=173.92 TRINITY_DN32203_c0_g1_i1:56-1420(+)